MGKQLGIANIAYVFAFMLLATVTSYGISKTQWWFRLRTGQHIVTINDQYSTHERVATFNGQKIAVPHEVQQVNYLASVLGESNKRKRIEVNLSEQKLKAYENDKKKFEFLISSGNPWTQTPTGTFYPWIKLRYAKMEGGNKEWGTYYNLPNVPYVVYFYNEFVPKWQGYGIHGAYWHNNFGHPMSHGCVNAPIDQMGELYNWMDLDTQIKIYGETPPKG